MAIGLWFSSGNELHVLAGYESGHVAIWQCTTSASQCKLLYIHKSHSQPILSLSIATILGSFYTSSADAIIARHSLIATEGGSKVVQTKHAGQQSLSVRNDEKIFATAGWDGRVRVYSAKAMTELAVLKWHKEGCYALDFADVRDKTAFDDNNGSRNEEEAQVVTLRSRTVAEQRAEKATNTHWLAVGSKDGKISLWDIY